MLTTERYVTNDQGQLVGTTDNEAVVKVQVWGMETRHRNALTEFLEGAKVGLCDAYIQNGREGQVGVVNVVAVYSTEGGRVYATRLVERIKEWVGAYERNMRRRIICTFAEASDGMRVRGMNLVVDHCQVEVVRGPHNDVVVTGDWQDKRAIIMHISGRIKK